MIKKVMALNELPIGWPAVVNHILAEGIARRRIMDLGLIPGSRVEAVRKSPSGDPCAFKIRGTIIAFRKEEASKILVTPERS
ncbi:MAG: FeoA family protein [Desulfocucumaceae bacterium]